MQELQPERKQKPLVVRLSLILILVIFFYVLGYSLYYLNSLRQFITNSSGKHISIASLTQSPNLLNQTNILLLGSDNDQKFTNNPLTQTMMIVHINYETKKIDMFSIPRDLWVKMPSKQTFGKIDQAAEFEGIPSAVAVVEQTFGIPIDHYAWVGLYGFIKSIDAIGGVNLQVVHPVLDNSYPTDINSSNPYGYKRLDIQPGMQHVTGEQALEYVRSRHEDLIGDFGRTQRQRQLLLTIKDTFFQKKSFIFKIPSIFDSLNGQIKTDITPTFGLQLGIFFLRSKNIVIKQFTLSPPTYSSVGNSTDGQSIVIGNATTSAKLITSIFGNSAGQTTLKNLSNVKGIAP